MQFMLKEQLPRHQELQLAGWKSRSYQPHFDGIEVPHFITFGLADSVPAGVIESWRRELDISRSEDQIVLQKRIDRYLDQGYGSAFLKDARVAGIVQAALLKLDGERYRLSSWVVMPNHVHLLATRYDAHTIAEIMHSLTSFTSHKANKLLRRTGQFWMDDYFDRYILHAQHYQRTLRYIENNPVKARLCKEPADWPFSSAWFRANSKEVL